jgi:hypothetical protein
MPLSHLALELGVRSVQAVVLRFGNALKIRDVVVIPVSVCMVDMTAVGNGPVRGLPDVSMQCTIDITLLLLVPFPTVEISRMRFRSEACEPTVPAALEEALLSIWVSVICHLNTAASVRDLISAFFSFRPVRYCR